MLKTLIIYIKYEIKEKSKTSNHWWFENPKIKFDMIKVHLNP